MKLEIKEIKKTKDGSFGNYTRERGHYVIRLSEKRNDTAREYYTTLVHEVCHFGFNRLRRKFGVRLTNKKEHLLIGRIERYITDVFVDELLKVRKK